MYSNRNCDVYVCRCLANLYFHETYMDTKRWKLFVTGVPVLVISNLYCIPYSNCSTLNEITIILAEKGTGFTLWKEVVDDFSHYTNPDNTFHTMVTSNEPHTLAGLSFDNECSALQFYHKVLSFTNGKQQLFRRSLPLLTRNCSRNCKKSTISTPVNFKHVTSLKPENLYHLVSQNSSNDNLFYSIVKRPKKNYTGLKEYYL